MLAGALAIWLTHRERPETTELSLREHLRALLDDYEKRMRLRKTAGFWITCGISAGVAAVIGGSPGRPGPNWLLAIATLAFFWTAQIVKGKREMKKLRAKRDDAALLLSSL